MNDISWFNKISVGSYVRLIEGWQKFFPHNLIKTRRYVKVEDIVKDDSSMSGVMLTIIDDKGNRLTLDASWFTGEVQEPSKEMGLARDVIKFLQESYYKNSRASTWIGTKDELMSVYIRVSHRILPIEDNELQVCYDLANIHQESEAMGKGMLRILLGAIEYAAKEDSVMVYIENILNPLLKEILVRYGYSIVSKTEPVSFYLDPSKKTTVAYDYFVSR